MGDSDKWKGKSDVMKWGTAALGIIVLLVLIIGGLWAWKSRKKMSGGGGKGNLLEELAPLALL